MPMQTVQNDRCCHTPSIIDLSMYKKGNVSSVEHNQRQDPLALVLNGVVVGPQVYHTPKYTIPPSIPYLVEQVDLVDVAFMNQHSQILSRGVDVNALQLPCLILGPLVAVETEIAQPSELCRLVGIPIPDE